MIILLCVLYREKQVLSTQLPSNLCPTYRYVILRLGLGGLELSDDDSDEVRAHDGSLGEANQPQVAIDGVLCDGGVLLGFFGAIKQFL